jgi:hypothetical protein
VTEPRTPYPVRVDAALDPSVSPSPLMTQPRVDVPASVLVPTPRTGVSGRDERGAGVG